MVRYLRKVKSNLVKVSKKFVKKSKKYNKKRNFIIIIIFERFGLGKAQNSSENFTKKLLLILVLITAILLLAKIIHSTSHINWKIKKLKLLFKKF